MYNERKDSGYTYCYNQGLLEGHDNGWDRAKESSREILERDIREAKHQWQENAANEYSEDIVE